MVIIKATMPIVTTEKAMLISKKAKLSPTAKESMLVAKVMLNNSQPRVISAPSPSSFSWKASSTFFLTDFSSVDVIVTDAGAPEELVATLRAKGLEVVVAPQS